MKEIFDSVRMNLFERITSPLFGAFVVSWFAWNFSLILVTFSADMGTLEKLTYIKAVLYSGFYYAIFPLFVAPLLSSVLFIFLYPTPAGWCYSYWHRQQMKRKALRDKIEGATLLTIEESQKVRLENIELKRKFEARIREQEQRIEDLEKLGEQERASAVSSQTLLKERIDELNSQQIPKKQKGRWDDVPEEIRLVVKTVTQLLEGSGALIAGRDAVMNMMRRALPKASIIQIEALVDDAQTGGMIERHDSGYRLTPVGRRFAIDVGFATVPAGQQKLPAGKNFPPRITPIES